MQYVRRLGASALVVAAAFAVAFAVLVSSADAAVQTRSGTTFAALTGNASNGDTVYIQNSATEYVTFEITAVGRASASFTHSSATDEGQKITCDPGSAAGDCDADTDDTGVTVALKIDNDSGAGAIFVKQTLPGTPATAATVDTITVEVAQVPTKISVKPAAKSINAGQGSQTATSTVVDLQLTDANGKGIAGETLTIVATRGVLVPAAGDQLTWLIGGTSGDSLTLTVDIGTLPSDTRAQAGSVTTTADADAGGTADDIDSAGYARVVLMGGGFPGTATITVTAGNITGTADVVLHGAPATIEATAEQSAIEAGGKTFIVVTATDSSGNPVAAYNIDVKSGAKGVVGPSTAATKVEVDNEVNKDGGTIGVLTDKGDIPACGEVTVVLADPDADPAVVGVAGSDGTNDAGQCVIEVDGGTASGTADDAARGVHTITIQGPKADGSTDVTVEIIVGGAPASITHDAPERIDPSDEITVNLTVLDDEAHRVGRVTIEVLKTAGDGAIITEVADKTSDGRAKFTYLAPSTPGVVEFLARTKDASGKVTAKEPIIIQIAAEEPVDPEPVVVEEAPAPSLTPAPAGAVTLTSFSGGSVDDLAAALSECGSGVAAHASVDGGWVSYIPAAVIVAANAPFNAAFAEGIPADQILQVTNCN